MARTFHHRKNSRSESSTTRAGTNRKRSGMKRRADIANKKEL